ncbi:hypothetical protein LINGRAHAP2_LOCUS6939 [Linum grandiflorum]
MKMELVMTSMTSCSDHDLCLKALQQFRNSKEQLV